MRMLKGMIAGVLALGGLMFAQAEASAKPAAAPELIHVSAVGSTAGRPATTEQCRYYGRYRHHGWRRHYGWRPYYGWRRPYGWHRRYYGYHRPWGWRHRHWRHVYY